MSPSRKGFLNFRISILSDEQACEIFQKSVADYNGEQLFDLAAKAILLNYPKTTASILALPDLSKRLNVAELINFLFMNTQDVYGTILEKLVNKDPVAQKVILTHINLENCSDSTLRFFILALLINFDKTIFLKWMASSQRENVINQINELITEILENENQGLDAIEAFSMVIDVLAENKFYLSAISILDNLLQNNDKLSSNLYLMRSRLYLFLGEHKISESLLLDLPSTPEVCNKLAINSLYDANASAEKISLYHHEVAKKICEKAPHFQFNTNTIAHDKKLNIGILMEVLNQTHAVFYFMAPILQADPTKYQLTFFDCSKTPFESTVQYLEEKKHKVINCYNMTARQLAKNIRDKQIDVLFDLSGHFADLPELRMSVFAAHPAPIQITYIAYPNTTGLPQMDYRLVDHITDPIGATDRYYSEELLRLDGSFLCFKPDSEQLEAKTHPTAPSTEEKQGFITLGILNSSTKLSDAFLVDLGEMLKQIPNSRLCFQYFNHWQGVEVAEHLLNRLQTLTDIPLEELRARVIFPPEPENRVEWISKQIDIAIDTYPYNGTTTNFDCLLAGVPIVTHTVKNRHEANVTASILTHLGKPEWITDNSEKFVQGVKDLAENVALRKQLREGAQLRTQLLASPLCDVQSHQEKLWRIVREKWHDFCNTKSLKKQIDLPSVEYWEKLSDEASSQKLQQEHKINSDEIYKIGLLAILQSKPLTLATVFSQLPEGYSVDLMETARELGDAKIQSLLDKKTLHASQSSRPGGKT